MAGHVLKEEELDQIRFDIAQLKRPSWITSVPSNLGSPSHGKLKADQWRVLGTTFLPASLVQMWSIPEAGNRRSQVCHEILQATFSLLSAVAIASSRITFATSSEEYLLHMKAYLDKIQKIFPDYNLHPNHHLALHLGEFIQLFGPVHSWWTFPFERVIGLLQRILTNYKAGKYPKHFARNI